MPCTRDLAAYERSYAASAFEPVQAQMRRRQVLAMLARWQPRRVLEIGCGDDALFNHYDAHDRFVVVEPGDGFAGLARKHAATDSRITVHQAYAEAALPALAQERFDCILVSGLLHEVPQPEAVLSTVAALCTPDTRVHVNVPNARSLHRLLALEMGLINELQQLSDRQQALQQSRTYDLDSLALLCRAQGFEVFESGSYFVKPFTHSQMAQLRDDGLVSDRMLNGLFGLEKHLPGLGSEIFVHLRRCLGSLEAT